MRKETKASLILILMLPFLTELLSGNFPLSAFFTPQVLVISLIMYGFAALVLRELSVKWKVGVIGIFIIGLAYGLLNEGIAAKSLMMAEPVVDTAYLGYPLILGINLPWLAMIVVWHALHSILYPILIISYFFPDIMKKRWLNKKWLIALSVIVIALATLMFFTTPRNKSPIIYLIAYWIVIPLIIYSSRFIPNDIQLKKENKKIGLLPAVLGFLFTFYTIGMAILWNMKVHIIFFYLFAVIFIGLFYFILKKKELLSLKALALFAFGNYLGDGVLQTGIGAVTGAIEYLISGIIFIMIFISMIIVILKRK